MTQSDVVHRLITVIRRNELAVGDRLPSIRELADRWEVNPSIVRSGFLQAATLGVIRMHPRAGAFVAEFDYARVAESFSMLFEMVLDQSAPPLVDLYELRSVIERETFGRVALRASAADLFKLREHLNAMHRTDERSDFVRADELFHIEVAGMSGNVTFKTVLKAVLAVLRPHRLSRAMDAIDPDRSRRDHEDLYQALLDGDVQRAGSLAADHSKWWISHMLQPFEQAVANRSGRR